MSSFRHVPTIVYLVKSLEAVDRMHIDRIVRNSAVTTMQYVALIVLEARDGLTAAELARRAFVTPQTMQGMVSTLLEKGLISRQLSTGNRKELLISLTADGRTLLAQLAPAMAELEKAVTADFSAAEEDMFWALLQRARRNAAAYNPRPYDQET